MSEKKIETPSLLLELDLPDTYEKMTEEQVAKVLKNVENTQFFRDKDRAFMITVTEKDIKGLENPDLDVILNAYCVTYSRTVAGFRSPFMGKKEINGQIFGALGFYSTTLTSDNYNFTFVTVCDDVEIVITMQSRLEDFLWSKKEFMAIIDSVKVVKKNDEQTA